MRGFFLLWCSLVTLNAFAQADLGKKLSFLTRPDGVPSFGVFYTYGEDPDGSSYLFSFSPDVPQSERKRTLRWNFYLRTENNYLMDWSGERTISMMSISLRVKDAALVSKLVSSQKLVDKTPQLYLVLSEANHAPIYHVSVSELCSLFPQNFKDMTQGLRCDQIDF